MNLSLDCEFNDPNLTLISMGLVSEDKKHEFYEVVRYDLEDITDDWVVKNVLPILKKTPIPMAEFQEKLKTFLGKFPQVTIYVDHPNDVGYMSRAMITDDKGGWFDIDIDFKIRTRLSAKASETPHNAISDARAILDSQLALEPFER